MSSAVPSPSAGNWNEDIRLVCHECRLLFGSEHQVAVTLALRGEGGKDAAAHAEIRCAHMRTFFGTFKAQSDATKIGCIHSISCIESDSFRSLSVKNSS